MNSALNPEAPEFHPHLTTVTKDAYTSVHKSIKSSNHLPAEASHNLFKTFTDFNVVSNHLSENVVTQSNDIIITESPGVKLKRNDKDYNAEKMIDANDNILDRVNINIDTLSGVNKPSDKFLHGVKPGANVSSWNTTPVISKIQVGSATFIGAKNILRPQVYFKDTIDNSDSLWVPKISDKPNSIKPLSLKIRYNHHGQAVGFEHPYKIELSLYHPPQSFIDPDPEPPSFPPQVEKSKLTFINKEAQIDDLVMHLNDVKEFAIDLEHHSFRTYQGITCLIQITTDEGGDFIIDALAVREYIYKLNSAFTDPKKLKVLHGAESDIIWLQRDFGVYIVGLFDTHQAAKALKLDGLSFKYLLNKYCHVDTDKKHRLADWRIRPLPDELIEYARVDTHYLLYIWRTMKAELLKMGCGQSHLLQSVFEQSRHICGTTYNKPVIDDTSHMPLYFHSKKSFNTKQMAALKMLFKWRDTQARALDESATYLMPNNMLLTLAETLPREVQGVNACCSPMPPFIKQHVMDIHRMILICRELPLEPQLLQMPAGINSVLNNTRQPLLSHNVHDLSQFPDSTENQQINLDNAAACSKEFHNFQPDIYAFTSEHHTEVNCDIVSDLNADAKQFIPPYNRYKKYRYLAQNEEMKEFKHKEAKISAISKGDKLIKQEILDKLKNAKTQIENDIKLQDNTEVDTTKDASVQRKRKITEKTEQNTKEQPTASQELVNTQKENKIEQHNKSKSEMNNKVKLFQYDKVDYTVFYNDVKKSHKQPKMKFNKHK